MYLLYVCLDHRRRGIDARGDQPNRNPFSRQLRDERVAQAVGRRVLRQTRRGGGDGKGSLMPILRPCGAVVVDQQWLMVGPPDSLGPSTVSPDPAGIGTGARSTRFRPRPFFELGIMRRGPSG